MILAPDGALLLGDGLAVALADDGALLVGPGDGATVALAPDGALLVAVTDDPCPPGGPAPSWGECVARSRRYLVGTDRAGRPLYAWTVQRLPHGCALDPGGSSEPVQVGRAQVLTSPRAYFRATGIDVVAGDRLLVRGAVWEVVGDPAVWRDPWGSTVGGTVVELRRSTEEG